MVIFSCMLFLCSFGYFVSDFFRYENMLDTMGHFLPGRKKIHYY